MKTIEEKIEDEIIEFEANRDSSEYYDPGYKTGFKTGAAWMKNELTRWRDPKEEMPEVGEFVQVKCERDSVWHDHDKVILDRFGNKKFEYMPYYVIGWRPIE